MLPITYYNNLTIETVVESGFLDKVQDYTTTEFAFWISVVLLLMASFLKYLVSHINTQKDWGHLIIEFPVDLCLVMLTILVTIYLKTNIGGGIFLIIITILTILICCHFRRKSMDYSDKTDSFGKSFIYGMLTVLFAVALTGVVYNIII